MSEPLIETLIALSGQTEVIVIRRAFVNFTDDLDAGMMLSQLLYWTPRAKLPGGWIAKSDKDWSQELCLKRYSVRKARKILLDRDLIGTKIARFDGAPTVHYRIKLDSLREQWIVWIQTMDYSKSNNPLSENEQTGLSEIEQSLTETTTKTTTETSPVVVPNEIMCSTHHSMMRKRSNEQGEIWYSHKVGNDWCQGAPDDQLDLKQEPEDDSRRYITGKYKDSLMY